MEYNEIYKSKIPSFLKLNLTHHKRNLLKSIRKKYLVWALGWGFGDGQNPKKHFQNPKKHFLDILHDMIVYSFNDRYLYFYCIFLILSILF